jgi:nucleoside-diphosphate-sugar epimerase
MRTVLVTGATGMIGANVCQRLTGQGDQVRAIARKPEGPDAISLRELGVEVVPGDITDLDCVQRAAQGVDGVIHTAALRGVPGATMANSLPPNVIGTINVLTASLMAGGPPVVQLLTSTFFNMWDAPQSEVMPLDLLFRNKDPYSVTKRLAYLEGFARVDAGQDIRFMLPGAAYGPSPCLENAMLHPNFNTRLVSAIRGEVDPRMPMLVPYVLADDCAYVCIAALDKGIKGERYIAMGRQQDVDTIANICNLACQIAGVPHRSEEVPRDQLDDPDVVAKYGTTMTSMAKASYPQPYFDSGVTQQRLGYVPTPLNEGLVITIDWMRRHELM